MKITNIKLGEYAELTGYLHEPSVEMKNIRKFPAILVIPGGGFRICSDREAEPVAMAYFAEGFQAFVLRYTVTTQKQDATIEDPMNDVQEAINWIRSHQDTCFVAENKLAMIGFSGGGHLAAASATHGPLRPDLLLLGYPGILHSDLRALECPDIVEAVDMYTPKTFIWGTNNDFVTPSRHPMAFAKALDDANVGYELHIFRDGTHGLSLAKPLTCSGDRELVNLTAAQWFKMSVDWLKAEFGEFIIYGINDGRSGKYSIDTPLKELKASDEVQKVLKELLPGILDMELPTYFEGLTLRKMEGQLPMMTEEFLEMLDKALLAIK